MEEKGLALELLSDYKKANKRQFITIQVQSIIILVLILMWSLTIGYLVHTLNDIGTVETTNQEITGVETIDNSNIANGDINGDNKAD